MADNPLIPVTAKRSGKVTVEMLEQMAASLNRSNFVIGSGLPYFVGKRINSRNEVEHFLDRKIRPVISGV